jgi:murein DD-endopeptidase MepM/ murein hydrolase activator NlpD
LFKKFYIFFTLSLSIFCLFFNLSYNTSTSSTTNPNKWYFPIESKNFSSYYGYRDLFGKRNFHDGIDIPEIPGTKIYACNNGVITTSSFIKGYGNSIIILHDNGSKSLYGHLSENYIVKNGNYVKKGEHIGFVGPKVLSNGNLNGYTTGPHLHFTIFLANGKTIDPLTLEYEN